VIYSEQLFRCRHGFRKGDDPETNTQSSNDTTQVDNRVGASEQATAIGQNGWNDQSFTDNSQTTLNTSDNSNRSDNRDQSVNDYSNRSVTDASDRSVTDNSQTTLNTSDNRDQSVTDASNRSVTDNSQNDNSDRRVFNDNSVHNTLDAELAKTALNTGAEGMRTAASVLEKSLAANSAALETAAGLARTTNGQSLALVGDAVGKLLDSSAAQTAAASKQQTEFLTGFYTDRENSDVKIVDGLAKYAAGALAVGAIAWALK
jgi:hypothetical protein